MGSHFRRRALLFVFTFLASAANALAQEEARAAWQVSRFNITANLNSTANADRTLTTRATIEATNVGRAAGSTFTVRINRSAEITSATVGDASARFVSREDTRTKLQQVQVTLPSTVAPGSALSVTLDYRLPGGENSGLAAISPEGSQFLPLSSWYPTPNTQFTPRGADTAPVRLTVNGASGETVVSTGQATSATSFEQTLNAQPFFLTGKWDALEGTGEARGISALVVAGATADERKRAEALINLAGAARAFYGAQLGAPPATPLRLVAVRRGAGFDMAGTLLLDAAVFRRSKTDTTTAISIAEAVARLWIGGATGVQAEGAGVVREGLARYLAMLFLEKQFGSQVANDERIRMALLYAPVARRDAPLSQTTPLIDTYFTSVTNKGLLAWRLVAKALGQEVFMSALRKELEANRGGRISLASLRAALGERSSESLSRLFTGVFDQPTETDLLVGLPQSRGGAWVAALRNLGPLETDVAVAAVTDQGERLTVQVNIPAKDFAEATFRTASRIARVEVDPEKFYPQIDYANDVAPRVPSAEEALAEVTRQFAQQQYARTEVAARELMRHAPQIQEGRVWLGRAVLEQNRLEEAEKEFRAALDLPLPTAVTLAWANIGLGEIALRRKQAAEAARHFDDAARTAADYGSTLAARAARIKAEALLSPVPPAPDESARALLTQFDQAIQSGRKAALDALTVPGELVDFTRGIVGNQPEAWQTRVVRTEPLGANRMAVDVAINAKIGGREQAGTAVFVLARTPAGWRLAEIQFFEVR